MPQLGSFCFVPVLFVPVASTRSGRSASSGKTEVLFFVYQQRSRKLKSYLEEEKSNGNIQGDFYFKVSAFFP